MSTSDRFCPKCGTRADPKQLFCSACGTPLPAQEPERRACPNCGTELDLVSPFCWKCGRAVAATPRAYAEAMSTRDREIEKEYLPIGKRPGAGGRLWLILTAIFLVSTVVLSAIVVDAWNSGSLPLIGSREKTVTLVGVNETIYVNGTLVVAGIKIACQTCPVSGPAGGTTVMSLLGLNDYLRTVTYTALIASGGFSITLVTPPLPQTVLSGGVIVIQLQVQLVNTPGIYFVPVSIYVTMS